ncbi:MAG: vitamin K epoxide reductase family protein [Gaiellaceae bacterium]
MSERTLCLASALLAAAGAAITAYLLYVRQTGGALVCSTGGCETVQSSPYAEVLGIPVAALGLAGFLALLIAALARGEWARLTQATLALSAFLFGAYLLYIQVVVIEALCRWCLATDVLTTAIAALALLRLRLGATPAPRPAAPARPYPQRRPNGTRGNRKPKQRARAR